MNVRCDLCEAAPLTTRYFADDLCWIADCEICLVPMVVWRQHVPTAPADVKDALHERLAAVADRELGAGNWTIDDHMRNIKDHYHAHARRRSFGPFGAG